MVNSWEGESSATLRVISKQNETRRKYETIDRLNSYRRGCDEVAQTSQGPITDSFSGDNGIRRLNKHKGFGVDVFIPTVLSSFCSLR